MSDSKTLQAAPYAGVLHYVQLSIKAEQEFCSIVSQMKFLPQFNRQPSLQKVHDENYETSYHRNTAAGNLQRIVECNQVEEILVLMTIECFAETRQHDKTAEAAFRQLTASNPADRALLTEAGLWHTERKKQLKVAARILHSIVGPAAWQKGMSLAE